MRVVPAVNGMDARRRQTWALLRAYHKKGDLQARERLIEENLPLVRTLARRYARGPEQLDDLVQVGAIGLIKAIDRFDVERGVELATYATATVLGEIRRYFRDRSWSVRLPRGLQERNLRLWALLDELTARLGRSPTIPELADGAGLDEEEVLEALESGQALVAVSLDAPPAGDDDDREPVGLGAVEHEYEVSDDRVVLRPALRALDERERRIVELRFVGGLTQSQIALEVGISQMHVSRLLRRALVKMRRALERGEPGRHRFSAA